MNLRWKQFERALRPRVAPYDARRGMSFWQRVSYAFNSSFSVPLWVLRTFAGLPLLMIVIPAARDLAAHPDLTLSGLGLWGLFAVVFGTEITRNAGQVLPEFRVLWLLPLTSEGVFRRVLSRLAPGTLWLGFECLLVYGILAAGLHAPPGCWAGALLCAAMQAAIGSALLLLAAASKLRFDRMLTPLFILGLLLLCAGRRAEPLITHALSIANPFGWSNALYLEGWVRGHANAWWYVLPVCAVVASFPHSVRRLRQRHFEQGFLPLPTRRQPGPVVEEFTLKPEHPTAQRRRILSGDFGLLSPWERFGPIERLVGRLLNAREKILVETLLPPLPAWSRPFYWLLGYVALFLAANWPIGFESLDQLMDEVTMAIVKHGSGPWAGIAGFFASFVIFAFMLGKGLSLLVLGWPESSLSTGSEQPPLYRTLRLLPANYWEITKVQAKYFTCVILLLVPLALVLSLTPAFRILSRNAPQPLLILPKCLLLLWATVLVLCSLKLTPSIQDGLKHWKAWLLKILVFLPALFVGMGLLASPNLLLDLILEAALVSGAVGWFLYSGRRYCQGAG